MDILVKTKNGDELFKIIKTDGIDKYKLTTNFESDILSYQWFESIVDINHYFHDKLTEGDIISYEIILEDICCK